jgi:cyclophilin family peptidyl-prolyl cis-trans isomerase
MPRAFLDIDINGHRAAYSLAKEFVETNNLKYGLSSSRIEDLGGSEKARLQELFENDYLFSSRGRIEVNPALCERLEIDLFEDAAPNAVKNFITLCTGTGGKAKVSGVLLSYKNVKFHRMVKSTFIQGGDFSHGNGAGGESIWGGVFKDDPKGLKIPIDKRGLIAMSNTGKNTNGSQFFISFAPMPKVSGKHVVFGRIVKGEEVLQAMESIECGADDIPTKSIVIADSGLL